MRRRFVAAGLSVVLAVQRVSAAEGDIGAKIDKFELERCHVDRDTSKRVCKPTRRQPSCPNPASGSCLYIWAGESDPDPREDFIVSVHYRIDGVERLCTGTIIGDNHVLTAGHCGCGERDSYQIGLGWDIHHDNRIPVIGGPVLFSPSICTGRPVRGRDIALLRIPDLAAKIRAPGYRPELLSDYRAALRRGPVTVVGYGYTEHENYGRRMIASIPVYSADCTERRLERWCAPYAEMVLADVSEGGRQVDSCAGDSGGPVFLKVGDRRLLVGITSRAFQPFAGNTRRPCGGGGIYTILGRKSVQAWFDQNGVRKFDWYGPRETPR